ncbi:hypothetical protein CCY99_08980 [Helicobacter sp. 16-1353]|uniref:tetratricopeptide repeat protein n=1 Tax=Helicobacter sp. 16-1353 TaxID=2004996 RepID=UPI000DCDCE23|nr:tetratricopeptide repeat protein [Helicobacter sp. 16-1353]RAX51496.1 hypothetical protein CCY99_08980 [Helicobacter sp. 16-1353]
MAASNPQNTNEEKNIIHLDKKEEIKKTLLDRLKSILKKIKEKLKIINLKSSVNIEKLKNNKLKNRFKNKYFLYAFLAICGILLACIIAIVVILNKEQPLSQIYTPKPKQTISPKNNFTTLRPIQTGELQSLIKKASLLYNNGQISEALDIYTNIAIFSQSFASFNLGVAKLREKKYRDSIDAFNATINSGDNVAAAAINAAVSAYQLGDLRLYDYYVNLAKGKMIEWYDMPLYSYLYSLVNYYSSNYFNMLSSLKNPNSSFYKNENSILLSKIYLMFNDDFNAIKTLLDNPNIDNRYAIGLLYARMGEYDLAYEQIDSYLRDNGLDNAQVLMAQALIEIKRSNFTEVSNIYEKLLESKTSNDLQKFYPIKIKLKDSLFNIDQVQKNFWNLSYEQNKIMGYKILFYFAPFKVFDIDNALSLIEEGGLALKMNNIEEANNILIHGAMLSRINMNIAQSIKNILEYNIENALNIMQNAVIAYPNHQVLQYNLGLIYAQLNDFENARKHFLKAFHLDGNDILSGIFALMCSQMTYTNGDRIANDITNNFEDINFESPIYEDFLRSLFGFVNGNISDDLLWFNTDSQKSPMMYALRALYSVNSRDKNIISQSFKDLQDVSNNDLVAMILYRIANHYDENIKAFSLSLFDFFKNDITNLDLVYTGPSLARQIYVFMAFLVGANSYVDTFLSNKLLNTQGNISGILEALALNAIYLGEFEKAFVYYNTLIDDYKLNTSEIYFLASVAAIGAGHYDNAVALIQLSQLESRVNMESRFALGLLHQSMGNFKLASLQFIQIGDVDFQSKFFDFEIDTSNILEE